MKAKFWIIKRGHTYWSLNSETGQRESLKTRDASEAQRIIHAKNEAARQPALNLAIAKAYLVGIDPQLGQRTWAMVMTEYCTIGKENTRKRKQRAIYAKPLNTIRDKKLIETTPDDLRAVIRSGGSFINHFMRCLHNCALGLGWLIQPIIPPKLWPKMIKKHRRPITREEHQQIINHEANIERRHYYELLWQIGASQTDAANLTADNIDWQNRVLSYQRQKTGEHCALLIGPRLEALLRELPTFGPLFPKLSQSRDSWRSAEFTRRCRTLKIEGVSLHSYRYAWASRAKRSGMPERFAQSALGHASVAVHREYAREGVVICPSLEEYENNVHKLHTPQSEPSIHSGVAFGS